METEEFSKSVFECPVCGKVFPGGKLDLIRHQSTQTEKHFSSTQADDQYSFGCRRCRTYFMSKDHLKSHKEHSTCWKADNTSPQNSSTKPMDKSCKNSDKLSEDSESLNKDKSIMNISKVKIPDNPKALECLVCGKVFYRGYMDWIRHVDSSIIKHYYSTHHTSKCKYECTKCHIYFTTDELLLLHQQQSSCNPTVYASLQEDSLVLSTQTSLPKTTTITTPSRIIPKTSTSTPNKMELKDANMTTMTTTNTTTSSTISVDDTTNTRTRSKRALSSGQLSTISDDHHSPSKKHTTTISNTSITTTTTTATSMENRNISTTQTSEKNSSLDLIHTRGSLSIINNESILINNNLPKKRGRKKASELISNRSITTTSSSIKEKSQPNTMKITPKLRERAPSTTITTTSTIHDSSIKKSDTSSIQYASTTTPTTTTTKSNLTCADSNKSDNKDTKKVIWTIEELLYYLQKNKPQKLVIPEDRKVYSALLSLMIDQDLWKNRYYKQPHHTVSTVASAEDTCISTTAADSNMEDTVNRQLSVSTTAHVHVSTHEQNDILEKATEITTPKDSIIDTYTRMEIHDDDYYELEKYVRAEYRPLLDKLKM